MNIGPSSTPRHGGAARDRTASRRIFASEGGGRPAKVRLFGEPGWTVTGRPYEETDTSSEDMIDGGGDHVWLFVFVVV